MSVGVKVCNFETTFVYEFSLFNHDWEFCEILLHFEIVGGFIIILVITSLSFFFYKDFKYKKGKITLTKQCFITSP